jgi:hypothetical protein
VWKNLKNTWQECYIDLGNQIQNQLIDLLSCKVKSTILEMIRTLKYFSVILDCTPDASHKEQISVVLRYVRHIR